MDKIILVNYLAVKAKYVTNAKLNEIKTALNNLVTKSIARGLETKIVDISNFSHMQLCNATAVPATATPQQVKQAVDAAYNKYFPDYLVLIGAEDIFPFVKLRNPVFQQNGDSDEFIKSDLPYACDSAYSTNVQNFMAPSRVVGRIPDIKAVKNTIYIKKVLQIAADATSAPLSTYQNYFGLTAEAWAGSTIQSIDFIFNNHSQLFNSPPSGPNWTAAQLAPKVHFINCHGGASVSKFFGQSATNDDDKPEALKSVTLSNKITTGTVIASECCYGASPYSVFNYPADPLPICNNYLFNGGYGFYGSSNIAYGPSTGNDYADNLCKYFTKMVLNGSSLGSSALQAKLDFILEKTPMDPIGYKTLAQFILLGDPSIHPVQTVTPHSIPQNTSAKSKNNAEKNARAQRRIAFTQKANLLKNSVLHTSKSKVQTLKPTINKSIKNISESEHFMPSNIISYDVKQTKLKEKSAKGIRAKSSNTLGGNEKIYIAFDKKMQEKNTTKSEMPPTINLLIIKECDGIITDYQKICSR